jgi:hypothetical protein
MEKTFLGVGLVNALLLTFFVIIMIVILKTVSVKYPVAGVTEVINAV